MLSAFAALLALTALMAWANERIARIPTTVGVTLAGALAALLMIAADRIGFPGVRGQAEQILTTVNFTSFVLNGILSVLLFAGALSLDATQMWRQRASVLTLATVSTLISTVLISLAAWGVFALVGIPVPILWAFLFGALISPTDPVAVLDLLKRAKVPRKLQTLIAGESLFNDGVGVVVYIVVAALAGIGTAHTQPSALGALELFAVEALGGALFGFAIGWICFYFTSTIEVYSVEILITLAVVLGGYVAAANLGLSGPIAMVVAGLVMSSRAHRAYHGHTRELVESFWETIDQILNILLFAFIGLDVVLTETSWPQVLATAVLIPVALAARFVSVAVPFPFVRRVDGYGPWTVRLLTWGGLRGGIAISLVLGLPPGPYRNQLVTATFGIVLFTIAVQGLTVMPLVRRASAADPEG